MKNIAIFASALLVFLFVEEGMSAMSRQQVKSAGKLLKNLCQPKSKITPAQIEEFHKGTFNEEKEIKSYMECILRSGQMMKDGNILWDSLEASIKNMEEDLSVPTMESLNACKGVTGADKYDLAFAFYKCLYTSSPENFFLP